jgi:hypothetical protein
MFGPKSIENVNMRAFGPLLGNQIKIYVPSPEFIAYIVVLVSVSHIIKLRNVLISLTT